jgi:hypothetical protein
MLDQLLGFAKVLAVFTPHLADAQGKSLLGLVRFEHFPTVF